MTEFTEYLYALVLVGLVSGVLFALSPPGAAGAGKYVKYALSAAVVVAVLIPVVRATGFAASLDGERVESAVESLREEYESRAAEARVMVIGESVGAAEDSVRSSICSYFGIAREAVVVSFEVEDDGASVTLRHVTVTLGISAFGKDAKEVEEYVRGLCGCGCTVKFV